MKLFKEAASIKNLNTAEETIIDDDGNISELEDGESSPFDYFADEEGDHALRPDGSHDGLDDPSEDGLDFDFEGDPEGELAPEDEAALADDEEMSMDDPLAAEGDPEAEEEDENFQGVIRTVKGACLVYKRKAEEGTYEELWVYNVGKNMKVEAKIRRSILAGTDINIQDVSSEDGTQTCEPVTIGNVQFLKITGLPN